MLNVGTRSVAHAAVVLKSKKPDLIAKVDSGALKVSAAAKMLEQPKKEAKRERPTRERPSMDTIMSGAPKPDGVLGTALLQLVTTIALLVGRYPQSKSQIRRELLAAFDDDYIKHVNKQYSNGKEMDNETERFAA
jgi:hypothetical protein